MLQKQSLVFVFNTFVLNLSENGLFLAPGVRPEILTGSLGNSGSQL